MIDEKSKFLIQSFVGASPIQFGMSAPSLAEIIGPPEQQEINFQGRLVEYRSFINVGYSAASPNVVDHIGFGRQMRSVFFDEINIFSDDHLEVLKVLCEKSEVPLIYLGFVYLLDLGIYLSGFHDEDESQRSIVVFPRGAYDNKKRKNEKV